MYGWKAWFKNRLYVVIKLQKANTFKKECYESILGKV